MKGSGAKSEKSRVPVFDPVLLFPVLMLTGIGIVMVYSASSEIALRQYGSEYHFFIRQLIFAGLGVAVMAGCRFIPYRLYRLLAYAMLVVAVLLLCAVTIDGLGHTAGGATRWLRLKWVSFQPSEFARLALIVFIAYSLTKKQETVDRLSIGFLPHVLVLLIFSGLIMLQPDFGTIAIFWALTWLLMYAGRVPFAHLVCAFILLLPFAVWLLVSAEYRLKRYITFLDPWQYPLDEGYQIIHSLMAFGSGGFAGKGFGQGYQKLFYLPTPHTDFIFSVIGEEGGLLWVLIVLALYLVVMWYGFRIAATAKDCFGSLLAFGITSAIALQAIVNMGVNLSLLPTKGLTLPLLSYGGSSLVLNLAGIGILMNISLGRNK